MINQSLGGEPKPFTGTCFALTANTMKEDIENTRKSGCNLHLSKPVRKKRLLETEPTGGILLIIGWLLLGLSAFRR
jgi:CheY-like chemotaxis protein